MIAYAPEDTTETFFWCSDDESIATVTQTGKITAKSVGNTLVWVESSLGQKLSCIVIVEETGNASGPGGEPFSGDNHGGSSTDPEPTATPAPTAAPSETEGPVATDEPKKTATPAATSTEDPITTPAPTEDQTRHPDQGETKKPDTQVVTIEGNRKDRLPLYIVAGLAVLGAVTAALLLIAKKKNYLDKKDE